MDRVTLTAALRAALHTNDAATLGGLLDVSRRADLAAALADLTPAERNRLVAMALEPARHDLLPAIAQAEREELLCARRWAEGTAGSLMTAEYATLDPGLSAREAVESLRAQAPDRETIYQAYVVDDARRLIGTLSLRELLLARPSTRVAEVMVRDVISVEAGDSAENAAQRISRHHLLALPVVDEAGRLVGLVTFDDALRVAESEATEDFRKAGGTLGDLGTSYRAAPVATLYRKRVFWLVLLVFGNVLSGAGIARFEDTIAAYVGLVFFLPLLIGSSGNAGAQSATLMVRALATGDVRMRDWGELLAREVLVAGLLGLTMALAVTGVGLLRGGPQIALVVAATMVVVVVLGSLIGLTLPYALDRLRLDPATASAPLVTSIADAAGVVIYFGIASAVLVPMSG